jgi:spore coat polysaccharide biosynthesis protein SpsF
VLAPVLEEPMILRQLERLRRCEEIDRLVVATSTDSTDDELAAILENSHVAVRRGPLDDVASRFDAVVREFSPTTIVRLTADCPLADPSVIDRVIREHVASGADYTSNTLERTFPQGLDVECVRAEAFTRFMALEHDESEREHVTLGIYRRPDQFTLNSVTQDSDLSKLRWTVDFPDDLAFVRDIYAALYPKNPQFVQGDVLDLLERRPELSRFNE